MDTIQLYVIMPSFQAVQTSTTTGTTAGITPSEATTTVTRTASTTTAPPEVTSKLTLLSTRRHVELTSTFESKLALVSSIN